VVLLVTQERFELPTP